MVKNVWFSKLVCKPNQKASVKSNVWISIVAYYDGYCTSFSSPVDFYFSAYSELVLPNLFTARFLQFFSGFGFLQCSVCPVSKLANFICKRFEASEDAVYFDQLLGAAGTKQLVELLFWLVSHLRLSHWIDDPVEG